MGWFRSRWNLDFAQLKSNFELNCPVPEGNLWIVLTSLNPMLPANAIIIPRLKRFTGASFYSCSRSTINCLTPAEMLHIQAGSSLWGPAPATYKPPHVLRGAVLPKLSVYCLTSWVFKGGFLLPKMVLSPSFEFRQENTECIHLFNNLF